jgi:hypothetical protein
MKNLFLAFTLSSLSFFGFSQSLDTTFLSNTFTSGNLSTTAYDDTLYLNQGESINLNTTSSGNFDVFTQPYTQGATPDILNPLAIWVSGMPYSYTFQTGFSDFVLYVRYQSNTTINYMYKILVLNAENQQTNSLNKTNIVDFNLYPNPASNVLNIDTDYIGEFQVLDMSGRVLISTTDKQISVSDLTNGQYILKANQSTKLFIKI